MGFAGGWRRLLFPPLTARARMMRARERSSTVGTVAMEVGSSANGSWFPWRWDGGWELGWRRSILYVGVWGRDESRRTRGNRLPLRMRWTRPARNPRHLAEKNNRARGPRDRGEGQQDSSASGERTWQRRAHVDMTSGAHSQSNPARDMDTERAPSAD
jgi:hypothetical protein